MGTRVTAQFDGKAEHSSLCVSVLKKVMKQVKDISHVSVN